MDKYKLKILKYQTKILNLLSLHGGARPYIYKNDSEIIIESIKNYLTNKEKFPNQIYELIEILKRELTCGDCWIKFIKNASFSRYTLRTSNKRDTFYIYPKIDNKAFTNRNYIRRDIDDYTIKYSFRNKFIALIFYNLMMFDFDFKDGITEKEVILNFYKIIEISHTVKMNLAFLLFRSDQGIHSFCISNLLDHNKLSTVELMMALCNDIWYTSFSYINGYGIRLNPKEKRPDDFIARPGSKIQKGSPLLLDTDQNNPFKFIQDQETQIDEEEFFLKMNIEPEKKMPEFNFKSQYYKKFIFLKYLNYYYLNNSDNILLIGKKEDINEDCFRKIIFHFVLIQYFKPIKNKKILDLECAIGEAIIHDDDIGIIKDIRDDIQIIHEIVYKLDLDIVPTPLIKSF